MCHCDRREAISKSCGCYPSGKLSANVSFRSTRNDKYIINFVQVLKSLIQSDLSDFVVGSWEFILRRLLQLVQDVS